MTEQDKHSEENQTVSITKDDIDNLENFFEHFKIDMPVRLKDQLDAWKNNPEGYTYNDQLELKAAVSEAMLTIDHEILGNDVWKGVLASCDETHYNSQFDRDLEDALVEKKD